MKLLMVIFVALVGSAVAADEENVSELSKPTPELIEEAGYTGEIHHVTTDDGYILEMHRISGSPLSPTAEGKPVVLLMHGLLSSSADWVVTGPENAFGFLLADAGYDVWMGNSRGNTYSKNHTNLSDLSDDEFWHFSWHEMGIYDLPAMIDYILNATDKEEIIYIGHSQGTTQFFVMTSLIPEYNDKIIVAFLLAPVAYVKNIKSPLLRLVSNFVDLATVLTELFGDGEFLPSSEAFTLAESNTCSEEDITQGVCSELLFSVFGPDWSQLNKTQLTTILGHNPAGASTRQVIHYSQEVKSGKFRQFDEGLIKNFLIYGSITPPSYDLSKVTAAVHLWYGNNDYLADPTDVERTNSELGNSVELYLVPDEKWNHIDFLWAINATTFVYEPIIALLAANYTDSS